MCKYIKYLFMTLFALVSCTFFSISAGAVDVTYEIDTPEDWLEFVSIVNNNSDNIGSSYYIANINADIDLSKATTLCNITRNNSRVKIYGNNHVISNATFVTYSYIRAAAVDWYNLGLINHGTGVIQDLILSNCVYTTTRNDCTIGAFCGYFGGTISNCYSVNNNFRVSSAKYVGGICGFSTDTDFDLCFNFSDIALDTASRLAGIVPYFGSNSSTIIRCANYGDLGITDISQATFCAGIAGFYSSNIKVENCYNLGNLYARYIAGIYGCTSAYGNVVSSYCYMDAQGYSNLSICYSPILLCQSNEMPSTLLRTYNFGSVGFINVTNTAYRAYTNYDYTKSNISNSLITDLNNGLSVWQLDISNVNNGYPVFVENYSQLVGQILPLVNYGRYDGSWSTLDGRAEGTFNQETGEFEYNITINAPDYSGALGNPNYSGSYTIPGEADDVGVDINDMSGLDTILNTDFSSLFLAVPTVLILFSQFTSGTFITVIIFVLLLTLIAWFFGRKV